MADDGNEGGAARDRIRGHELAAPELIDVEVISALRRAKRIGLVDDRRALEAIDALADLPIQRMHHRPLRHRIWDLRDTVSAYDATYVAAAEALGCTLLTRDQRLHRAAGPKCAVELLTT
ncbi:MAG: type II toxin-antitoxin system VapC family toxin [Aeromicrobium sp.]